MRRAMGTCWYETLERENEVRRRLATTRRGAARERASTRAHLALEISTASGSSASAARTTGAGLESAADDEDSVCDVERGNPSVMTRTRSHAQRVEANRPRQEGHRGMTDHLADGSAPGSLKSASSHDAVDDRAEKRAAGGAGTALEIPPRSIEGSCPPPMAAPPTTSRPRALPSSLRAPPSSTRSGLREPPESTLLASADAGWSATGSNSFSCCATSNVSPTSAASATRGAVNCVGGHGAHAPTRNRKATSQTCCFCMLHQHWGDRRQGPALESQRLPPRHP